MYNRKLGILHIHPSIYPSIHLFLLCYASTHTHNQPISNPVFVQKPKGDIGEVHRRRKPYDLPWKKRCSIGVGFSRPHAWPSMSPSFRHGGKHKQQAPDHASLVQSWNCQKRHASIEMVCFHNMQKLCHGTSSFFPSFQAKCFSRVFKCLMQF